VVLSSTVVVIISPTPALTFARKAGLLQRLRKLGDLGPFFNRWPFHEPWSPEVVLARSVLHREPDECDPSTALRSEEPDDPAIVDRLVSGKHDAHLLLDDGLQGSIVGPRATGELDEGAGDTPHERSRQERLTVVT
jgi:hypothetical protein